MRLTAGLPIAAMTRHDIAGVVAVVAAVVIFAWAAVKLVAKAAKAYLLLFVGLAAIVVAVLLFTRAI
jgi:hypothetical protein